MPTKLYDSFTHIVNSSAVAVLAGLSRVLIMKDNDFKAKITVFTACVCSGLIAGIILGNNGWLPGWHDALVAISSLCAKEIIEFLADSMKNPIRFYSDLRNTTNKKNDPDSN